MLVESSNILMSSTRSYSSSHRVDERLRAWNGNRRPDFEALESGGKSGGKTSGKTSGQVGLRDLVEISRAAGSVPAEAIKASGEAAPPSRSDSLSPDEQAQILLLEKIFEQLTGKKIEIKFLRDQDFGGDKKAQKAAEELQRIAGEAQAPRGGNNRSGWGIEYDRTEHFEEAERTTFSTTGVVRTADGKEIQVAVDLAMSREFVAHNEVHLRQGDAVRKDPLVINFDGNAAQLTTDKFSFDIDLDGTQDQISFVKPGAGFLALDKNGDGAINNGSELFGPTSGDGFTELAAYDTDGNHWIDEGDAVFNKLRIWTKDADGADRLLALGEAGVGAIYLGNVATQFSVNDSSNQQLGMVQSTGIWLGENGGAGTIQHLDLVV